MKLMELLLEAEADFVKKYEVLYKHFEGKRARMVDRVKEALTNLEKGVSSGVIYNVTFNEIKSSISHALETSLEELELQDWDNFRDEVSRKHYDISHYVQLNQTKGQVKHIKAALADSLSPKVKESLEQMLAVNEAAGEIKVILDGLKSKVIKGRKPSENIDPNAFRSKMGSKEAQQIVLDSIKGVIGKKLDEYEKSVKEYLQDELQHLEKVGEYKQNPGDHPSIQIMLLHSGCYEMNVEKPPYNDRKTKPIIYKNLKINAKGKKFPETEAKDQRDGLEKNFLAKNLKKLSHLVELKGNLEKIEEMSGKPVRIRSGSGTLEVGFKFLFKDGSEFKVINKIVTKYSYTGTRFEQFPTTFHDVVFSDKTKMKIPSEEKMIKEFGAKHETA